MTKLSDRVYQFLADDEDARVCKDIPESACVNQPRAFLLHLWALSLTKLGDALVSARLVLPWMLSALGAPVFFISALVPIRESLALLPQLIIAQQLREHALRKWFWVAGSIGQALALIGMLCAIVLTRGLWLGWSIIGFLVLFSIARGVCSVAIKDVLGKTISKTRRGRLSGLAASIAGLLSVVVALVIIFSPTLTSFTPGLERITFMFLLGGSAALWVAAAIVYAKVPELEGATEGGGNAIVEAIKSLQLLWADKHFSHFVVTRALLVASAFAIPYMVVMIQRSGSGALTSLGGLMLASGLAGLLAGRFWGLWSDRASEQVMAVAALLSTSVMTVTLAMFIWAPDWLGSHLIAAALIFTAAVAHHGARVGRTTYLLDMADSSNRAQYTAVSNTFIGVILLLGMLLGGLDTLVGIEAVMGLLIGLGLLATWRALKLPNVQQ